MSNGRDWSSVEVFKKKKILIINVNLKCMLFLMYDIWKYDKKKKGDISACIQKEMSLY